MKNKSKGSPRRAAASRANSKLSPAGSRIVAAFEEATEALQAGRSLEETFTVHSYPVAFTSRPYGPDDVRRVRGLLGMGQAVFARFLGVSANTVRSWEQGTRPPQPIARRFLGEIEADPGYWRRRIAKAVEPAQGGARR